MTQNQALAQTIVKTVNIQMTQGTNTQEHQKLPVMSQQMKFKSFNRSTLEIKKSREISSQKGTVQFKPSRLSLKNGLRGNAIKIAQAKKEVKEQVVKIINGVMVFTDKKTFEEEKKRGFHPISQTRLSAFSGDDSFSLDHSIGGLQISSSSQSIRSDHTVPADHPFVAEILRRAKIFNESPCDELEVQSCRQRRETKLSSKYIVSSTLSNKRARLNSQLCPN